MDLLHFFLLILLTVPAAVSAAQLSVWPVDSLTKVFPDDPPGKNRAEGEAWLIARNGHASVQLAVYASALLPAVEVDVKLSGRLQTQVRRVGYVPVRADPPGTPAEEVVRSAPEEFPDPLFEDFPFRHDANQTAAVWITVYAPPRALPGLYKGEAVFKSDKHQLAKAAFQIRVPHATVPAKQSLKVTNWFYLDEKALGRYYDLGNDPERYWQIVGNIGRVLADHKQNVIL